MLFRSPDRAAGVLAVHRGGARRVPLEPVEDRGDEVLRHLRNEPALDVFALRARIGRVVGPLQRPRRGRHQPLPLDVSRDRACDDGHGLLRVVDARLQQIRADLEEEQQPAQRREGEDEQNVLDAIFKALGAALGAATSVRSRKE